VVTATNEAGTTTTTATYAGKGYSSLVFGGPGNNSLDVYAYNNSKRYSGVSTGPKGMIKVSPESINAVGNPVYNLSQAEFVFDEEQAAQKPNPDTTMRQPTIGGPQQMGRLQPADRLAGRVERPHCIRTRAVFRRTTWLGGWFCVEPFGIQQNPPLEPADQSLPGFLGGYLFAGAQRHALPGFEPEHVDTPIATDPRNSLTRRHPRRACRPLGRASPLRPCSPAPYGTSSLSTTPSRAAVRSTRRT
jgi:hypothetical protein